MRPVRAPSAGPRPAATAGGDQRQPAGPDRRGRTRGWLGEIEGLQVSLAGARDKLAQIDAEAARRSTAIHLGMPAFPQIAGRIGTTSASPVPG